MAIAAVLLATSTSIAVGLFAILGAGLALAPALGLAFVVGQLSFFLFIAKALACRALRARKQSELAA
ncbi:MAG: hypothetical protein AAFV38_02360 [Pseudomonadota bacterium]